MCFVLSAVNIHSCSICSGTEDGERLSLEQQLYSEGWVTGSSLLKQTQGECCGGELSLIGCYLQA